MKKLLHSVRRWIVSRNRSTHLLNVASTQKEQALLAKAVAETNATQLESLRKNAAAFSFGYGLVIVFCYCFFDLNFFPSGLSTGDVLFFLFAAFGLGLMSLFCTVLGMSAFLPATLFNGYLPSPKKSDNYSKFGHATWYLSPFFSISVGWVFKFNLDYRIPAGITFLLLYIFFSTILRSLAKKYSRKIDWVEFFAFSAIYLFFFPYLCYIIISVDVDKLRILTIITIAGIAGAVGLSMISGGGITSSLSVATQEEKRKKFIIATIIFTVTLSPGFILPELRLALFQKLGVRTENASIIVDKPNLALLQSAADAANINLNICHGDQDQATIAPINVLWHASGTRSLVQFPDKKKLNIELSTSGLKLIRGDYERCIDINEKVLFKSGKSTLLESENKVQIELNNAITPFLLELKPEWKIKSARVIGHADPMPIPNDGNNSLAKDRAEIAKSLLLKNLEFTTSSNQVPTVIAISVGSRQPIKNCDTKETKEYQRSCNEINRRVEIRFRLERRSLDEINFIRGHSKGGPMTTKGPQ
jgi:outer membrane protein OmpA-like peptidoglycan-associated protein